MSVKRTKKNHLPANKQQTATVKAQTTVQQYQGPIPDPQSFSQYNQILPGAADRILAMAEKEAAHRQNIDEKNVWVYAISVFLGQVLAFILGLVVMGGGVWIMLKGQSAWGYASIITGVGTLVSVFILGRKPKK